MAATNKYAARCAVCEKLVPANAGTLVRLNKRWIVTHPACEKAPTVHLVSFNSGATISVNANGRCIDAPCCGCCS